MLPVRASRHMSSGSSVDTIPNCFGSSGGSSWDTIPNCLDELGEIRERTGIAADGLRQARLEPLALSVSGRERMFNGWAAASGEKRINFSAVFYAASRHPV